jgi:hypothetical protein
MWPNFSGSASAAKLTRQGSYVIHYTASGTEALNMPAGELRPELIAILSDLSNARHGRFAVARHETG